MDNLLIDDIQRQHYKRNRLIMVNPFSEWEMLMNENFDYVGPYIPLDELLLLKDKLDAAIAFAKNEDVAEWNNDFLNDIEEKEKRSKEGITTKKPKPKDTKVYLMIDRNTGLYKIGRSIRPYLRESTLQSEKPTIELLFNWDASVSDEKKLHRKYAAKRVRGEWFDLSPKEIEEIKEILK